MGEVFIGIKKDSQERVAIKKLHTFFKGKDRLPTILNEINVMESSKHANIVNFIGAYSVGEELWVMMEYMDKGSLYDLDKNNIRLEEKHMACVLKQVSIIKPSPLSPAATSRPRIHPQPQACTPRY